jgi:hypothetical protein
MHEALPEPVTPAAWVSSPDLLAIDATPAASEANDFTQALTVESLHWHEGYSVHAGHDGEIVVIKEGHDQLLW